jgi:large conductance mechanosensitive channel
MGMLKEFKDFAVRGNVVDMAVGIIIGAAFGKIVSSMVGDVLMPVIGKVTGGVNFSEMFIALGPGDFATRAKAAEAKVATINYGVFINTVIDFVIVAFCIFLMIKQVNRFKKAPPPAAPTTKDCPQCAMAIPIKAKRCGFCTSNI